MSDPYLNCSYCGDQCACRSVRDELEDLKARNVRLSKALHDVAHPIMDSSDEAPVPDKPEPLCTDAACLCSDGFCFCPDDPGCLDLNEDGDGKHYKFCIEARAVLQAELAQKR